MQATDRLSDAIDTTDESDAKDAADASDASDATDTGDAGDASEPRRASDAFRRRALVAGLTALLAVPLLVAVAVQRSPTWYPSLDLAEIEMHVRDVGTSHSPLLGLGGRIQGFGKHGSHPGPISFYALAPVYRLFGSDSWALQVSAAAVNIVAIGLAVWLGRRRWGTVGVLATAAGLALLMRSYGFQLLTAPWNPHFPIMWWPVVLLAAWSILVGDVVALPLFVLAGSMCAQTHVSYVGQVGGMTALVVGGVAARAVLGRRSRPDETRRLLRWLAASAAFGLVLWLPPIVEQLTNDPGNMSVIIESFRHPIDTATGLSRAWDLVLRLGNPVSLLRPGERLPTGGPRGTVALLVMWAVAAAGAVRLRDRRLLGLHAVVGAALVLAVVSISRIFGPIWIYLAYWLKGTIMLTLGAVVATALVAAAAALERRPLADRLPVRRLTTGRARVLVPAGVAAVALVATVFGVRDASDASPPEPEVAAALRRVAPETAQALDRRDRYIVSWSDPVALGSTGMSLLLDLDRRGFDAGLSRNGDSKVAVGAHRTFPPHEADAEVHVAVGDGAIGQWRARPGADEVARYEPRTPAERDEAERLQREIIDRLRADGQDRLAETFAVSRMGAAVTGSMPAELSMAVARLNQIPVPVSVFVEPLGR
jgi:hypothetical protein